MATGLMTVGTQLQAARAARNLSLADVTRSTKIQPWVLEALEGDRLPEMMSPIYVKGFLATYARFLRLEPEPLVAQLRWAEPEPVAPQEPLAPTTPPPAPVEFHLPQLPWPQLRRLGAGLAVSAAVIGLIVVNPLRHVHMPHLSLPSLKLPTLLAKSTTTYKPKRVAAAKPKSPVKVAKSTVPAPTQSQTAESVEPRLASVAPITEPLKPPAPPALALPAPAPLELKVTAERATWIQVRADGKLLIQQKLPRGAHERWTAKKQFEVIVSKPSQVELLLNGQPISPFAIAHRGRVLITHQGVTGLPEN